MRSLLILLLLAAGCPHAPPLPPPFKTRQVHTFRLHVIDVGTGLSILVRGQDFALLYDAGSNDDIATGANNRVVAYLKAAEPDLKTLDHVFLSHPHRDHVELLADVIEQYEVKNVWDSGVANSICGYRRFLEAIAAKHVPYRTAAFDSGVHDIGIAPCHHDGSPSVSVQYGARVQAPAAIDLGADATAKILFVDGVKHGEDFNRNTLVLRLELGGAHVLLMGDAEAGDRDEPSVAPTAHSIEGALLACCTQDLKADLLIAGHHGSKTSSRRVFVQAVHPSYSVISSGPTPYGKEKIVLPDPVIETELAQLSKLYKTYLHDADCKKNKAKVGRVDDGEAGGCDNILIKISNGQVGTPTYWIPHH